MICNLVKMLRFKLHQNRTKNEEFDFFSKSGAGGAGEGDLNF